VTKALDEQSVAFEELKKRANELEKKYDGLANAEMKKINEAISKIAEENKTELSKIHAAMKRGNQGTRHSNPEGFKKAGAALHSKALDAYVRDGRKSLTDAEVKAVCEDYGVSENEVKAMVSDDGPRGGFLVPTDTSGRIIEKIFESSVIGQLASQQTITTQVLEGLRDEDEAEALMVGERAARTETDTPDIGKWSIPVHECYTKPKISQTEIDDSALDLEAWLQKKVTAKLARKREQQFVNGNGTTGPRGIITYTQNIVTTSKAAHVNQQFNVYKSGSAGDLTNADKLVTLIFSLKKQYRNNATWLISREGMEKFRLLKQDGKFIWAPSVLNLDGQARIGSMDGTVLGYPVAETNDLPDWASGAVGAVFGDIAETYQIVDRQGMRVLRDPYSSKPYVELYTTIRFGGDVLNFEAFSGLVLSA